MPSTRSTQPRLVTEPTMKPTLAAPRHVRTPTWTRCIGCCALAPAKDAASMVRAAPARVNERRIKKSPAEKDVMRAENQEGAIEPALASLCHNIGGHARFAALQSKPAQQKRGPLPRATFSQRVPPLNRDGDGGECAGEDRQARTGPAADRCPRPRPRPSIRSGPAR